LIREVILGDEAKIRVPSEFWIQSNTNANPPTFFLPLYKVKINFLIRSKILIKYLWK
jgi:hypothetical protein